MKKQSFIHLEREIALEFADISCPLCRSGRRRSVGKPRRINALFTSLHSPTIPETRVVTCRNCKLVYVHPFPKFSDRLLEKMYSKESEYFYEFTQQMERIIHYRNPMRRFRTARRFAKKELRSYLEVGCGQGYAIQAAQESGWSVSGQDVSPDNADTVKKRTGIDIMLGQIEEGSYPQDSFDFIYIDSVLEHVTNPSEFMKCLVGFLSPGGVIYLTIPNEASLPNLLADLVLTLLGTGVTSRIAPFTEPYHVLGYSKPSIKFMASMLGLEVPYLVCRHTHYIERSCDAIGIRRLTRRYAFRLLNSFCDMINAGMNMEAVLRKAG